MSKVTVDGIFIKFPAISVTVDKTSGEKIVDTFNISVPAANVVGITGLDAVSKDLTGGVSAVHFTPDTGMLQIISSASQEDILEAVKTVVDFFPISIDVVSVVPNENTGEKYIARFTAYVEPEQIVGVNSLDDTTQQVTDDARTIVYFKPVTGLKPMLSTSVAAKIVADINVELA